jgi:hypothetical protein
MISKRDGIRVEERITNKKRCGFDERRSGGKECYLEH